MSACVFSKVVVGCKPITTLERGPQTVAHSSVPCHLALIVYVLTAPTSRLSSFSIIYLIVTLARPGNMFQKT